MTKNLQKYLLKSLSMLVLSSNPSQFPIPFPVNRVHTRCGPVGRMSRVVAKYPAKRAGANWKRGYEEVSARVHMGVHPAGLRNSPRGRQQPERLGGVRRRVDVSRKREKEAVILVWGLPMRFPMPGILYQREPRAHWNRVGEQGDEEDAEEKGPISNYLVSSGLGRPSIFAHHRSATFYRHSTGVGQGGWSRKFCENWKFWWKIASRAFLPSRTTRMLVYGEKREKGWTQFVYGSRMLRGEDFGVEPLRCLPVLSK